MNANLGIVILLSLALLYWWARDQYRDHERKTQERFDQCPHPPEQQRTIRVNNILTMNPALLHRVIPGRRWLVKQCDRCGKQWQKYRPTLQPWDEFVDEFNQETRDRAAQYEARKRVHEAEEAEKERRRREQRDRNERA